MGLFKGEILNLVNIKLLNNDRILKKILYFEYMYNGIKKRNTHASTMSFCLIITGGEGSDSKEDESTESQQWTCEQ